MGRIGLLVGAIMHSDVIYRMTFKPLAVKRNWLRSRASEPCSLVLKVQNSISFFKQINSGFTFVCNHLIDNVNTSSELTCSLHVQNKGEL